MQTLMTTEHFTSRDHLFWVIVTHYVFVFADVPK